MSAPDTTAAALIRRIERLEAAVNLLDEESETIGRYLEFVGSRMSTYLYSLGVIMSAIWTRRELDDKNTAAGCVHRFLYPDRPPGGPIAGPSERWRLPARYSEMYGSLAALRELANKHDIPTSKGSRASLIMFLLRAGVPLKRDRHLV